LAGVETQSTVPSVKSRFPSFIHGFPISKDLGG
jgi:hypothetical protein